MSKGLIPAYQKFKTDAKGWGVPPFAEFRERLAPLRDRKSQWSPEDETYVQQLASEGAGVALYNFFGSNPAARKLLGATAPDPEPLSRDELAQRMTNLVRNCQRQGWAREEYQSFVNYLDSEATPDDLVERRQVYHNLRGEHDSVALALPGTPKTNDMFADNFRRAKNGYKRLVRESMTAAAATAEPARARAPAKAE